MDRRKEYIFCQDGKVRIEIPPPPPPQLMKYYDVQQSGRLFLTHIRKYNNTLASIGSKEHVHGGFNPTFTIQGKLYHRMGNLLRERGGTSKFSQIYSFDYDTDAELNYRLTHSELDPHILQELQSTLHSVKESNFLFDLPFPSLLIKH